MLLRLSSPDEITVRLWSSETLVVASKTHPLRSAGIAAIRQIELASTFDVKAKTAAETAVQTIPGSITIQ